MDSSDEWDKVVHIEEEFYEKGRLEALSDSYAHGEAIFNQGRLIGVGKGYAIAAEMGFYEGVVGDAVNRMISESQYNTSDSIEPLSVIVSTGTGIDPLLIDDRCLRRCQQLLGKISRIPDFNDDAIDFESLVGDCRQLYKLIANDLNLPKFPPLNDRVATHDW